MALQHHYTVVAVRNEDGTITAYLDDADSGLFPEGSVYDTESEEWTYPGFLDDPNEDIDLSTYISTLLEASNVPQDEEDEIARRTAEHEVWLASEGADHLYPHGSG